MENIEIIQEKGDAFLSVFACKKKVMNSKRSRALLVEQNAELAVALPRFCCYALRISTTGDNFRFLFHLIVMKSGWYQFTLDAQKQNGLRIKHWLRKRARERGSFRFVL